MFKRRLSMLCLAATTALVGVQCTSTSSKIEDNPLVREWNTPFQTPPFNQIKLEHYQPALEYAIQQAKEEFDAIIRNPEAPTFENTIVAMTNSGELLGRVAGVFYNLLGTESTPELRNIQKAIQPMMTEYSNYVALNDSMFARVKAVYDYYQAENRMSSLRRDQQLLLEDTYKSFAKEGANLSAEDKEVYRQISMDLSQAGIKFTENVLESTNAFQLHLTKEEEISGIPESVLAIAAQTAKSKDLEGWVFDLSAPSYFGFMKYADSRALREKMYRRRSAIAYGNDEFDNREEVLQIVNLRLKRANLLGYDCHADYVLEDRMAQSADNVNKFLKDLGDVSMPFARKEIKELEAYAQSKGFSGKLMPWDFSYYSNKLKEEKYSLNDEALKPYFELNNVKSGVFELAHRLYGLNFVKNDRIAVYNPEVEVYEVRGEDDKLYAILYMDFYARPTKRAGAWMTSFREQYIDAEGNDVRPLVQIVLNYSKPNEEGVTLLTFSEANTLLHEFGHALHGMLSECTYQSQSGTSVPRDFVELPSQIMENWAVEKEFLNIFAKHYKTGEVLPDSLVEKIIASQNFMAGYASIGQITFATLDMKWHSVTKEVKTTVGEFETRAIKDLKLMPEIENTNISVAFSHIFSGGYAAGYYGYKWAEVLDADAFSLFKEKGIFNKEVADSFRKNILSKGGTEKAEVLYRNFRGRDANSDALLKRSGLK